jgi:hypothetical protein
MPDLEITCPSGLRGTLREMKVRDEQLFANRKLAKSGKATSALLRACWQQTLDSGPYSFVGEVPDWDQVLTADRFYALIQLRIASYGEDYEFPVTCRVCRTHFRWGAKLDQLNVQKVSEQALHYVKTNEPVPIELPDGLTVKCRPLNGEDEAFFAKIGIKEEDKILTYHLARRIVEIQGKTSWREILPLVEDMPARVADRLWDATDELEGGVELMFHIECGDCGALHKMILPFDEGFFSSRKRFTGSPSPSSG